MKKHIKCVLIGDGACGKTDILVAFMTKSLPNATAPSIYDNYSVQCKVEGQDVELQLWDTAGQEDYKKLRPLSYAQTDIFIAVFSLVSITSLENIENMWIPEIREHCPDTPFILVGTKRNLRDDFNDHQTEYRTRGLEPVSREKGIEIKQKLNAEKYIECDENNQSSLRNVFFSAIKVALKIKKSDIYRIGIYGGENSGMSKLASRYILGEFTKVIDPSNEDDFVKIVEVKNKLIKLTIDDSDPNDLSIFCGLIFVFSIINENSLFNLVKIFKSVKKRLTKKIPFVIVANFGEMRNNESNQSFLVPIEKYEELKREFKCDLFEVNSMSNDDIEATFYHIINKFVSINKEHKKK